MTLPTLDASFEDNPHLHSLRIPPLQHPFHAPSIVSKRPPPLEPNARVNIDKEANKLTGRQRALAEAKPLGVSDSIDIEAPVPAKTMREFGDNSERSSERPRKKQKLCDNDQVADFVQLPKPQAKVTDAKPRPFQPISVLNELHEPPPSAALFPPITPSVNQEEHDSSCSARQLSNSAQDHARRSRKSSTGSSNAKRNYTRERTLWTQDETECLVKGVAIYGMGKWKKILDHPELHFLEGRTNTDLKDRWVVLGTMKCYQVLIGIYRFRVLFPPNAPHKWVRPKPKPPVDYHGELSLIIT